MLQIDACHIGPPKTATTWLWHTVRAFGDIAAPRVDASYLFDLKVNESATEWCEIWDRHAWSKATLRMDFSQSYALSEDALDRIHTYNRDMKIILTYRDPVARAWSQHWHDKKKRRHNYEFSELQDNAELSLLWLSGSRYGRILRRLLDRFPGDSVFVMNFEGCALNPVCELNDLRSFLGLESIEMDRNLLAMRINQAHMRESIGGAALRAILRASGCYEWVAKVWSSTPVTFREHRREKVGDNVELRGKVASYIESLLKEDKAEFEALLPLVKKSSTMAARME